MSWFFKELLKQDATGLATTGILVLTLVWTFLVPVVRVPVHWGRRFMVGAISMLLGFGVIVFAGMSMGSVHGVGDDTQNTVIFIAAIVLIFLPFFVAAMARKIYLGGARKTRSNVDV